MIGAVRACAARPDGSLEVLDGLRPAARSGREIVPLVEDELIPLPEGSSVMHLPDRAAYAIDGRGSVREIDGLVAVAAVLPVGYLRLALPASQPAQGAPRLPLFGYTAVAERDGVLCAAAMRTDSHEWWSPPRFGTAELGPAIDAARVEMPGNRLVEHLVNCATVNRCYTAQNTLLRRYEGALPASPACNADCLGCISLQTDGAVAAPQDRMRFAPTADELVELAAFHLSGEEAAIVSFGQGCEGEPLTRDDVLAGAVRRIRRSHPDATIHINTNGSKPHVLAELIDAGCNSVRISAISFNDSVFRAYYRPVGYTLDDVIECGRVMRAAGGQVCLNLLTFPGITDSPAELESTAAACREMDVQQVQWRSLNVDHDWLIAVLDAGGAVPAQGIGMRAAHAQLRAALPGAAHGNFTRPVQSERPVSPVVS